MKLCANFKLNVFSSYDAIRGQHSSDFDLFRFHLPNDVHSPQIISDGNDRSPHPLDGGHTGRGGRPRAGPRHTPVAPLNAGQREPADGVTVRADNLGRVKHWIDPLAQRRHGHGETAGVHEVGAGHHVRVGGGRPEVDEGRGAHGRDDGIGAGYRGRFITIFLE